MPGRPRTQAQRAALEARARAMRARGFTMAEIEAEVGVPASTLYQWAARGRWRLGDMGDETAPIPAERSERRDLSPMSRTQVPDRPTAVRDRPALCPDALRAAGEAAMARALGLAADGRARAAREALLLGQRFVRAAEVLAGASGAAGGGGAAGAGPQGEASGEDAAAELEARLHRIITHAFKQDEAVAGAIGLEADVRWLDLTAFALPGGGWRRATHEEKARIAANDWPLGISELGLVELRYARFAQWGGEAGHIPPEFTRVYGPLAEPPAEGRA